MFVLFICCSSQIIWSDVFDDSIIKDKAGTGGSTSAHKGI